MNRSLRMRILAGTSLAGILVLGFLCVSVYWSMRHALLRDFDSSLRADARLVAAMIDNDDNKLTLEFDPQQMPEFLSERGERYFEVWRPDGSVLGRSPSLGARDLGNHLLLNTAKPIELPDTRAGRAVLIPFTLPHEDHGESASHHPAQTVTILIAAKPARVHRTLALLAALLGVSCTMAVLIMGLVLLRVVSQGLRPLTRVAVEIGDLRETDLSHRLSSDTVPLELLPVVHKLNGLLGRLDQAFTREKSFTADVSHELRTPLAGLRSILEVCRSRPRDTAAYESALDDCLAITDRMQSMVQSLLLLARTDAGQLRVDFRRVDLGQLISQCWMLFQRRADERRLHVAAKFTADVFIASDPKRLRIVLENLLDNAVTYADEAGNLRMTVHAEGSSALIEIINTGSQIATEDAPHLFDRFWRGDAARADANHSGIGLSICKRLTALLRGQIDICTVQHGEFRVRLRLPGADAQMSGDAAKPVP